jgi:hypothetical protein
MKVAKKGDAFLIYNFPSPDVEPCPHEIPSKYQEFKDVKILCPSIDHTITPLILRKKHDLHSDPSLICHKMNL